MPEPDQAEPTLKEKLASVKSILEFRPKFTLFIIGLGLLAAVLEGFGLTFVLPIIELVQSSDPSSEASGVMAIFISIYRAIGLPLTVGNLVIGVAFVMTIRYTTTFVAAWLRESLRTYYIRHLQVQSFKRALYAEVDYFDERGSDDMLNVIVTQTYYAGRVISLVVKFFGSFFISLAYLLIALIISPLLAVVAVALLGGLTVVLRGIIDPGYRVGEVVADANERRQEAAQAGTQGIRDVRIFGLMEEIFDDFISAVDQYSEARIILRRNEAAINEYYNWGVAITVFVLIFLALEVAELSIGAMGVFLFAMFRLGPQASQLNKYYYQIENFLPHLVRTHQFIDDLDSRQEPTVATTEVPDDIESIRFVDVWYSYDNEGEALRGIDFQVQRGEFIAFVGRSGAGKSTIVSLLTRFYEPDAGEIRANDIPINHMGINAWRSKLAIVRQNPYIFNDTLRYNLTIGNRDVTEEKLEAICSIAKVDEFLNELPDGLDTLLGDDGVRLSGGQRQRVALARALISDAEVLVLDEATSDLDSDLEKQVQSAIEAMDREYAMITIAHRLSTVENADRIYTLENGEITEVGDHDELMKAEGRYAHLYNLQS